MTDATEPPRGHFKFDVEKDEWVPVHDPYKVKIVCADETSRHGVRLFESEISKAQDDGKTPMAWRSLGRGEWLMSGSPDVMGTMKSVVRETHSNVNRIKLRCPVCKSSPVEVRVEKLNPILDTLARAGVYTISLDAVAARLRSASAGS